VPVITPRAHILYLCIGERPYDLAEQPHCQTMGRIHQPATKFCRFCSSESTAPAVIWQY
jgi:hypothetical protein